MNKINLPSRFSAILRLSLSLVVICAALGSLVAQNQQTGPESSVRQNKPATDRMDQRIEEAAIKYQTKAPFPRIALYHIMYPDNNEELAALDGNAVVLITALSQVREELPFKRVYVSLFLDGQEIDLKPIKSVLSEQSANALSAKTFGAFRADALYLLPIHLCMEPTALMIDFAKNKTGMKLALLGIPPEKSKKLNIKVPTGKGPSDTILEEFIKRQYPRLFTN